MSTRRSTLRSLVTAGILALSTILVTVGTVFADGGGIGFPK